MDNNQIFLANLLSWAIRDKKPYEYEYCGINWPSVFNEALEHRVHDLIFPTIKKLEKKHRPDEELMNKWHDMAIYSGCRQTIEMDNMSRVLSLFNSEGIEVISLKGLVLRELYPQPVLRSMSDADILIHLEDFEKAQSLLYSLGYYTGVDTNPKEVRFFHKTYMMIELHWLLVEPGYINNSEQLEKDIWINKENFQLGNVPILTLSTEDNIIYLLMHMILHFKYRGFGLRQLCDLVLLVEAKKTEIDWPKFNLRLKSFGIDKFTEYTFRVCEKLLDFEIPCKDLMSANINSDFLALFIDDIFSSGVFGYKNPSRDFITRTIERLGDEPVRFPSKINLFFHYIFPSKRILAGQYKYVEKFPLLIPVAWIQRFFTGLFSGRFINDFGRRVNIPKGTKHEYEKRNELFRELDLH